MSGLPHRRVAVVDDHEIFRLRLCAALAVVSARIIERERFRCPVVVCANELPQSVRQAKNNRVTAVLHRDSVTSEQLVATVRAAAAGLRGNTTRTPHRGGG